MKNRLAAKLYMLSLMLLLSLFCMWAGCSSTGDLPTQISGKWHNSQSGGVVDIMLDHEPKSLTVDGQPHKAEVTEVNNGSYVVKVRVEMDAGQPEIWTFHQIWNDNGSGFKLAFSHDDVTETLVADGQS